MSQRLTPDSALALAVDRLGSQGKMARLCGVKQPSVWRWLRIMHVLPSEHVLKVEAATGVSRHDLRPDIYPRDMSPPADSQAAAEGDRAPAAVGLPAAGAHSVSSSIESPAA